MINEKMLMQLGFVKEENDLRLKEFLKTKGRFKEIHIDIYPENPFLTSNSFSLLLRASEFNAKIIIDGNRLVFKKNDKYETHFMNVLIPKITECFSKMCENYYEFILNIQNVYYKITVLN